MRVLVTAMNRLHSCGRDEFSGESHQRIVIHEVSIGGDLRRMCRSLGSFLAFECRYFLSSNPPFSGVYRPHHLDALFRTVNFHGHLSYPCHMLWLACLWYWHRGRHQLCWNCYSRDLKELKNSNLSLHGMKKRSLCSSTDLGLKLAYLL